MTKRLTTMALACTQYTAITMEERSEIQYQSIRIISILIKHDEQWISTQNDLVTALKQIWYNSSYQVKHKQIESLDYVHWKEPKLLVKILLHYFSRHPTDIDLLFQLLKCLCDRFIPDFQVSAAKNIITEY